MHGISKRKPRTATHGRVRPATVDDVARIAGVSATTVSRVMNGSRNVSDAVRSLVTDAASQLSYVPNQAARVLASGVPTHVGLIYSNPSAAYLSQFLIGTLRAARAAGTHLIVQGCSEDPKEQARILRGFASSDVRGVIIPPPLSSCENILAQLRQMNIPAATIARAAPRKAELNVRIDDYQAACEMTRYLLHLGHSDIAFIRGHPDQIASHERERGFLATLAQHGLRPAAVEQGDFTYKSGVEATRRIMEQAGRVTAIFASNDDMAAAAMAVAHREGFTVPDDISIVGFDDTFLATMVWPELTTVRQPIGMMTEVALQMVTQACSAVQRRTAPAAERVLEHSLVIRGSSAPRRRNRRRA